MKKLIFTGMLFLCVGLNAQVLTLRQQAAVIDEVLSDRLNNLLPSLMEKNGIDMWVLITREYNEDPIVKNDASSHLD
jgi:hypothetical protein